MKSALARDCDGGFVKKAMNPESGDQPCVKLWYLPMC